MKFTKLTLVALLLALLVCAFAACGGETVETEAGAVETDAVTDAAPETELTPETDANGEHVHTIVEKIDEPTCEQRGYKREVCATCDEQISVKPLDMVDHTAETPATCTTGSLCKFCGTVIEVAQGHVVTTYTDTKPATKTEAGYNKGNCTVCGEEVTEILPAGITDNFNNFPTGALDADVMAANSEYEGFTFKISTSGGHEIAEEGNNKYLKKLGVNSAFYYVSDTLNAKTLEITFDFRLDQDCKNLRGLLSIVNGGKEMRIINVKGNGLYFGINEGGIVKFLDLEVGKWINIKTVINTETYDYEIYIDGEMILATTGDPANDGMHLVHVRKDGEMVVEAPANNETLHNGADRSPFAPVGDAIQNFYFFNWSEGLFCSLDNITARMAD